MAAPHRSSWGFPSPDLQVRASDGPHEPQHHVRARLLGLCLVSHHQCITAGWDGTSALSGSPAHLLFYAEIWKRDLSHPLPQSQVTQLLFTTLIPSMLHRLSRSLITHLLLSLGRHHHLVNPAHPLGLSWHLLMVKWFPPFPLFLTEGLTGFQDMVLMWCTK